MSVHNANPMNHLNHGLWSNLLVLMERVTLTLLKINWYLIKNAKQNVSFLDGVPGGVPFVPGC